MNKKLLVLIFWGAVLLSSTSILSDLQAQHCSDGPKKTEASQSKKDVSYAVRMAITLASLVVHEFSHAAMATAMGDTTPQCQGRLTLDPFAHLDVVGTALILAGGGGWAKPVAFNADNFNHYHTGTILTALAGPFSNYILALIASAFLKVLDKKSASIAVLREIKKTNLKLVVFNLLPIPPLDGSHLYMTFLQKADPVLARTINKYCLFLLVFLKNYPETAKYLDAVTDKLAHELEKGTFQIVDEGHA